MKKLFGLFTVMTMAAPTMVSAEEITVQQISGPTKVPETVEKTTQINRTIDSSYTVVIPQNITLSNAETQRTYTVNAKGNIAPTQTLKVTVTKSVTMNRSGDDAYATSGKQAAMTLEEAVWTGDKLLLDGEDRNGTVTFDETKAGIYTGTATFTIDFSDTNSIE